MKVDYSKLNTSGKIAEYTKDRVQYYRSYPEKMDEVINDLAPLFCASADAWKIVIDTGKFRAGFIRTLGVNDMKALRKLLLTLDKIKYSNVDFGVNN